MGWMGAISARNDVRFIRKAHPVINNRSWLGRTEVWIARHEGRANLLIDVVVGLPKGPSMSRGIIGEA